ncbi:8731_t:CDS:1, partial [Racocetra persica]
MPSALSKDITSESGYSRTSIIAPSIIAPIYKFSLNGCPGM